ncbi:MAG: CDP-glycerol glycerophosphotransferase family protein [Sporolactobacillus sp.]
MLAKKSFLSRRKGFLRYLPAMLLAVLLKPLFFIYFKKKKIVLIGGHCGEKYADNAAALHRFLIKNHPEYTVYFGLTDRNDTLMRTIGGPTYQLGSVWNYLLYGYAVICYYSHSLESDVAPEIDFTPFARTKLIKVYLGHGIDGLKRNLFIFDTRHSNYFVCSSKQEKLIKKNEWGIPENKLIVTGLPRYDELYLKHDQPSTRTILYMPTWREWLNADQSFFFSDFYKHVSALLNNQLLEQTLLHYGYHLKVMLHPFLHSVFKKFMEQNHRLHSVYFCNPDEEIQKLILRSDVLITDYSSVSWDFYYLDKPVLFYQFDQSEYLEKRGSYLDFSKDLFGSVTYNADDTVKMLGEILSLSKHSDYYQNKINQKNHFDFYDTNNCQRVVQQTLPNLRT